MGAMLRLPSLRIAASIFVFSAAALTAAPAPAATLPAAAPGEATYAAVLRTINPKLPLERARAYARSVMADAWRTHLDPRFIMSIVTVESGWHANAVSRVGARGLGQLMPGTAATLGVNAWSPSDNLRGTSKYLASLMSHFAGKPNAVKLAIAGYNAGPKAVERYHGVPPYTETRNYVTRVLHVWKQLNARVGRALAPAPAEALAQRSNATSDVRQWLSDAKTILPAAAPAKSAVTGEPVQATGAATNAAAAPATAGAEAAGGAATGSLTTTGIAPAAGAATNAAAAQAEPAK
jgi:Transglycosylase SLT domain